ncbi:MAG: hypothetical protein MUO89_02995 [Dehalococcoidia bacterium]|nr:hypothetical protein [Dehalococcoidia bacterium]
MKRKKIWLMAVSLILILLITVSSAGFGVALASEETDDIAASLGLTPAEFNVFVEGVHEYFGNRFP